MSNTKQLALAFLAYVKRSGSTPDSVWASDVLGEWACDHGIGDSGIDDLAEAVYRAAEGLGE